MTVRAFARAAGLDIPDRCMGPHALAEYMARNPAHLTPMIQDKGLPRGVLWKAAAIMQYLATSRTGKILPEAPAKRAMVDSAMST